MIFRRSVRNLISFYCSVNFVSISSFQGCVKRFLLKVSYENLYQRLSPPLEFHRNLIWLHQQAGTLLEDERLGNSICEYLTRHAKLKTLRRLRDENMKLNFQPDVNLRLSTLKPPQTSSVSEWKNLFLNEKISKFTKNSFFSIFERPFFLSKYLYSDDFNVEYEEERSTKLELTKIHL